MVGESRPQTELSRPQYRPKAVLLKGDDFHAHIRAKTAMRLIPIDSSCCKKRMRGYGEPGPIRTPGERQAQCAGDVQVAKRPELYTPIQSDNDFAVTEICRYRYTSRPAVHTKVGNGAGNTIRRSRPCLGIHSGRRRYSRR
jgi:hypothetical protein